MGVVVTMLPEWYTPFHLRESWLGSFQAVVGLTGLDLEGDSVDRRVWELLNLGTDLAPTFILNPTLPRKKPRVRGQGHSEQGHVCFGWYIISDFFCSEKVWNNRHTYRKESSRSRGRTNIAPLCPP